MDRFLKAPVLAKWEIIPGVPNEVEIEDVSHEGSAPDAEFRA